jgi:hypothetical protein
MGGVVARSASELAKVLKHTWPRHLRMVVALGSPNQGARLELLGHLVDLVLGLSSVTRPLARIGAARSQEIKDLRRGLDKSGRDRPTVECSGVPLRLIAANRGAPHSIAGRLVGDGLVTRSSAWDDGLAGDVQRVELARMGHMALLNHPRVYAYLRGGMRDGSRVPARRCRMKISKPAERA